MKGAPETAEVEVEMGGVPWHLVVLELWLPFCQH